MQFPGVPITNDKLSIMQTIDLTIFHVEWLLLSSAWLILGVLQVALVENILSALHSAFKGLIELPKTKFSNLFSAD